MCTDRRNRSTFDESRGLVRSRTAKREKGGARRRGKIKWTNREALLFDPGPIARVSGPPRSVGVTQVATPIRLMGTNIIIAASSSLLSIQINWCFLACSLLQRHAMYPPPYRDIDFVPLFATRSTYRSNDRDFPRSPVSIIFSLEILLEENLEIKHLYIVYYRIKYIKLYVQIQFLFAARD